MAIIYIGIGSNLGDKEGNCKTAIERLSENGITVKKTSSPYRTKPWGVEDQPDFVNMAVKAETNINPSELLPILKTIEKRDGTAGRRALGPPVSSISTCFFMMTW